VGQEKYICPMNTVFLKAEWRNLILANYEFDRAILKKYLPAKTEFDSWNGKDYVSLVGFLFKNTRLKGIAVPFHTTFEEVNLRFYVRYKENGEWKRGVVFVKEIVPKSMIALVANKLYKEHYSSCPMNHKWEEKGDTINISYSWENKDVRHCEERSNLFQYSNGISVKAENKKLEIPVGSGEEFITEHYHGYSKFDEQKTGEYKVEHPRWKIYPVMEYNIVCDFEKNYGSDFKSLTGMKPNSVYLAEGSGIKVYNKVFIR
jgi:uncharacterized protein YqjF (DUF2071 family)